ncbi:MAG TPA: STAS domain-containing protein [Roseiflexaceae bacterium]|nr:STAS domain-containing protein [Roseiflexaceae bacterium]
MDQQQLIKSLREHVPEIARRLAIQTRETGLPSYTGFSQEQLTIMCGNAVGSLIHDLEEDTTHFFADYWQKAMEQRVEQGAQIEDLFKVIALGEAEILRVGEAHIEPGSALDRWFRPRLRALIYSGFISMANVFTRVRERIIREQAEQIRELSTPIIPLYEGVLALPLVGAIDSYRASQVLETLLTGISEQQAEVVIIDITGVPVVDTGVAHHLLQSARAARLLGAQVVLVGIGPEIAQTLTQLGADLSGITTRANLQAGVQYALELLGLAIIPLQKAHAAA